MEDLQSFKIKSSIHDYEVRFEGFYDSIRSLISDGDVIIIDKSIYDQSEHGNMKEFLYWLENSNGQGILGAHKKVVVDVSEKSKEYSEVGKCVGEIIESGFRKGNKIIAIGGGVVQDISGFIASTLYRGVDWVFYPTTLLAQGDSCIGGKSSINFGNYKNQLGGFYPPHQIIIDTNFLSTLPGNQIISGLGEMAHYFMIQGGFELEFFKEAHSDRNRLDEVITQSLRIKKRMVEIDEFDKGPRLVFNYGHSFGHVIESLTNYGVPHGIAVVHGMDMANYVSWKIGISNEETYLKSNSFLKNFWGGTYIKEVMIDFYNSNDYFLDRFIELLKKDKKNTQTHLGLILSKEPGYVFKQEVRPDDEFKNILREYSKQK